MPPTAFIVTIAKLASFVALAYFISLRRLPTFRGVIAFVLFMMGAVQCYALFEVAARDDRPEAGLPQLAIAAALFLAAALVSGKIGSPRRKYSRARGVVTAVEPVTYGDETRWKVRFAYFDDLGNPQESADEVRAATWKPGDECVAAYLRESRDSASLEAVAGAVPPAVN